MNAREQKILSELGQAAEDVAFAEKALDGAKKRRAKAVERGFAARLPTADLAEAARVEPVTIRSWRRRGRLGQ